MQRTECYIGQRVRAVTGSDIDGKLKGSKDGDIYYIGNTLVNVEFDYQGTVAALSPADIEPI